MILNRAEIMKRLVAHTAAAKACEKWLKDEAQRIFEVEGTADTWKPPGVGTLAVHLNHDAAVVTNEEMFLDYIEATYPDEIKLVRQVRNPAWQAAMLAGLIPMDPQELKPGQGTQCHDREGTVVKGVAWHKGGTYRTAAFTPNPDLKREYTAAARAYVENGTPMLAVDPPPPAVD
jgi:hypothetical protein